MLRYRLLALGIKQPDFKDLLGYGSWFKNAFEIHYKILLNAACQPYSMQKAAF